MSIRPDALAPAGTNQGRSLRRLTIALMFVVIPLTGCASLRTWGIRRDPLAGIPRPRFSDDPQLEEVVDHLNRNVEKLHGWQANSVKIRANNMPLSGTLAVEEGQHLRLVVHSLAGEEVDLGSNNDVFWIWAKRMEPAYVYCHHDQIDAARQTLGVPFEPQWLMQALGVSPIDTRELVMQIDATSRRARLVQPVVTAHGHPMQKVMLVDLVHGVILEHSIRDHLGQKIAHARLEEFRLDKSTGVVLPRRVVLEWPQNKMSMVMHLGRVEVNPSTIPSQVWEMPRMAGVQMVDLGGLAPRRTQVAENDPEINLSIEPEEGSSVDSGRNKIKFEDLKPAGDNEPKRMDRSNLVDPVNLRATPSNSSGNSTWYDE